MPRTALALGLFLVVVSTGSRLAAQSPDPHLDTRIVRGGCQACHKGHGQPRSPMLPTYQAELCLSCHGSRASLSELAQSGALAADARPQSLSTTLAQPFVHPISEETYSARATESVSCTSCHSPHRGQRQPAGRAPGSKRVSTKNPVRFEYELCESCHGDAGVLTQNPLDLSRLLNPQSLSYHPVEAETTERSPSVKPELAGKFINCTDCHGNSDQAGPAGPHGSQFPYLVRLEYVTTDGTSESETSYALCYDCHDRELVLNSPRFPLHRLHVVEEGASCATCHNAHGSVKNRALIRFAEETYLAGVSPSTSAGILAFESGAPGAGACYLLCHGVDHAPQVYGSALPTPRASAGSPVAAPSAPAMAQPPQEIPRPPRRRAPKRESAPPP